jgi:hypothetical protein
VSGRVCELCCGNGSTEHRAAVCHLFCVKFGDNAITTHGKLQQNVVDDAVSRAQAFAGTKPILNAEFLLKMSSATDDHQQH